MTPQDLERWKRAAGDVTLYKHGNQPQAVALATDNALLVPELAAGIARVNITTTKRPARPRHHRRPALPCAVPMRGGGVREGRSPGGFTPEATAAARHANAPGQSVWCLRGHLHASQPSAR